MIMRPSSGDPDDRCDGAASSAAPGSRACTRSRSACKAQSGTPYDYVQARAARACSATRATPSRRRRRDPARHVPVRRRTRGYCQHFSGRDGAAAADGRHPGARRRRASRPGSWTASTGEYVVRDLDAHSWVEAYFPRLRLGHVRPDAGAPAPRARAGAPTSGGARRPRSTGGPGGDRPSDPHGGRRAAGGERRAAAAASCCDRRRAAARVAARDRGAPLRWRAARARPPSVDPELAELERALRRQRPRPRRPTTDARATSSGGSARPTRRSGYLRAVAAQRYAAERRAADAASAARCAASSRRASGALGRLRACGRCRRARACTLSS